MERTYGPTVAENCRRIAGEIGQNVVTAGILDEAMRRKDPEEWEEEFAAMHRPFSSD